MVDKEFDSKVSTFFAPSKIATRHHARNFVFCMRRHVHAELSHMISWETLLAEWIAAIEGKPPFRHLSSLPKTFRCYQILTTIAH
jgi:hypothetical protein